MSLPRIACFHGGGSSAAIFQVQCLALQKALAQNFEFVFFDAPFFREAGPGVLPFFTYERFGPYRTWFSKRWNGEEIPDGRAEEDSVFDGYGEGGIERVLRMMEEVGGSGEWIGCMGFSQGTRVVGGLLLEQQRRNQMGLGRQAGGLNLRFGILCMGSGAPMESDDAFSSRYSSSIVETIHIPTLHVHGLRDKQYGNGKKQLLTYYSQETATAWDVDYHHAMPWHQKDVKQFASLIRQFETFI